MTPRAAARLVWPLWALSIAGFLAGLWLQSLNHSSEEPLVVQVTVAIGLASFGTVGAVISSRRPKNPIGWIFLVAGVLLAVGLFGQEYARYAYVTNPQRLPMRTFAAWISEWTWYPSLVLISFMTPLLFPTGKPISPRWRPLIWIGVIGTAMVSLLAAVPEQIGDGFSIHNPIGIYSTRDAESEPLFTAMGLVLLGCLPFVIAAPFVRWHRSRGVERQQLKWFLYAASIVLISSIVPERFLGVLGSVLFGLGVTTVSLSVGIAISKYRLYDIDRIINKSIVYGALTAILVTGYAGSVLVLQALLPLSDRSPIAVAASTLAMAALFGPLRTRVQAAVDRRFYRARYNAEVTVESFGARLRRQTDLDALTGDLLEVVGETVQPLHASLWLRGRE